MDGRRVAEVVADFSNGNEERGSGFLLRADVLLTAWHVVAGADRVRAVFEAGSSRRRTALMGSAVQIGTSDIAVARLDRLFEDAEPVHVGAFGQRPAVVAAEAFGFPRFKIRNLDGTNPFPHDGKKKFRELAQVPVTLAPQGNWRTGRCELIVVAPASDSDLNRSAWEGMSGAPVFDQQTGTLVAVVTDHHRPEGLSRLAAARLDTTLAALSTDELATLLPLLGIDSMHRLPTAGVPPWVGWRQQASEDELNEIIPAGGLQDRDEELAELAAFCASSNSYTFWQAPPWAGKTALMATFARHPPAGVTVVSYFITARQSGENDSTGFLRAMSMQLAVLMGESPVSMMTAREVYRTFLAERARQARAAGHLLLLLVDGLDEDTGTYAGSGVPSIASLLPRKPIPGLKVIVAGRPDPKLPPDLPADHALRLCTTRILSKSPHAAEIGRLARLELMEVLSRGGTNRDVVGLIAASGGGLSLSDLEQLTEQPNYLIEDLLDSVVGRTIRGRLAPGVEPPQHVYLFSHDTLHEKAAEMLGEDQLSRYRNTIHRWADEYRPRGWPSATPRYLLAGYQKMLVATGDMERLMNLARDRARHEQMLEISGGDDVAYSEIHEALGQAACADRPDLPSIVQIARERDRLQQRNRAVPLHLPRAWAKLGQSYRSEALARSIPDPQTQVEVLLELVETLTTTSLDRARQLGATAEKVAHSIPDPVEQQRALVALSKALAVIDLDRARKIAVSIPSLHEQTRSLMEIYKATSFVDRAHAERLAAAIQSAPDIGMSDFDRVEAIAWLAEAIAESDPDFAAQLAVTAESISHLISDAGARMDALALLVRVVSVFNVDWARRLTASAESIVRANPDEYVNRIFLPIIRLVEAVAVLDPDRAEQIVHSIPYLAHQVEALVRLTGAVVATDVQHAKLVAAVAERTIHSEWRQPGYLRAGMLLELAETFAKVDRESFDHFARAAEQAAADTVSERHRVEILVGLVGFGALLGAERVDQLASAAEQCAEDIRDPEERSYALGSLVEVIAPIDHNRAEQIAFGIPYPDVRAQYLVSVAEAIASFDAGRAKQLADTAQDAARAVVSASYRSDVLSRLVLALTAFDIDRAEQAARCIDNLYDRSQALVELVAAVAPKDYRWAERITQGIVHPVYRSRAQAELACTLIVSDADRAERIVREISDPDFRAQALIQLLKALTPIDQQRARRIGSIVANAIRNVTDRDSELRGLADLAEALVPIDTHRALEIVLQMSDPSYRARAIAGVVGALAKIDADHAEQITRRISNRRDQTRTWLALIRNLAPLNPERAVNNVCNILDPNDQTVALEGLVATLAPLDPYRAEKIARNISMSSHRSKALATVAIKGHPQPWQDTRSTQLAAESILLGGSWLDVLEALPRSALILICDEFLEADRSVRLTVE